MHIHAIYTLWGAEFEVNKVPITKDEKEGKRKKAAHIYML